MTDWSLLAPEEVLLQLGASGQPDAVSPFLDTHQFSPLLSQPGLQSWGGHPAAQRRRISLTSQPEVSNWSGERQKLPERMSSPRVLRQYMQSLGLLSDELGDIIFGPERIFLAALPGTDLRNCADWLVPTAEQTAPLASEQRATCASLRLDAVLPALFKVSRGEAQTAIEYGFVFVNFSPAGQKRQAVKAGDQLVYRTKGRGEIVAAEENSRSGRQWVSFRLYPA